MTTTIEERASALLESALRQMRVSAGKRRLSWRISRAADMDLRAARDRDTYIWTQTLTVTATPQFMGLPVEVGDFDRGIELVVKG